MLHAVLTHGTNWSTIASFHTPSRNTLALKNRYSALRLRHDNKKKANGDTAKRAPEQQPSGYNSIATNTASDAKWNPESPSCPAWDKSDEISESDDEDEEDEDEEGMGMSYENGSTAQVKSGTDSKGMSIEIANSSLTSWDTWIEQNGIRTPLWDHSRMQPKPMNDRAIDSFHFVPCEEPGIVNLSAQYPPPGENHACDRQNPGKVDPSGLYTIFSRHNLPPSPRRPLLSEV